MKVTCWLKADLSSQLRHEQPDTINKCQIRTCLKSAIYQISNSTNLVEVDWTCNGISDILNQFNQEIFKTRLHSFSFTEMNDDKYS